MSGPVPEQGVMMGGAAELRKAADRLRGDEDVADIDAVIPGLCSALADWLDGRGGFLQLAEDMRFTVSEDDALAVARLINGGAA